MNTKVCKKCGQELPIHEFYSCSTNKDKLQNTCRNCRREERGASRTPNIIHCPVCNKDLPYYKFLPSKKGITGRMWCCEDCFKAKPNISNNNFRKTYDKEFRDRIYRQKRESRIRNYRHYIWNQCRNKAKRKGIEFNLEESDIIVPKVCPILEIPLEYGTKSNYDRSPSIDRIDNTKGYVKGNVWIISEKANKMKNSATYQELQTFCKNILRYSPSYTKAEGVESRDKEL